MRAIGIHLVQDARREHAPARSTVVEVAPGAGIAGVQMCRTDSEVIDAVGPGPALVLVDAPLATPEVAGRRDPEHVLAWLDIPAFPVTPGRMRTVHGGARGVELAQTLTACGHVVAEAIPDQILRQIMWEADHPPGAPALDLATYRAEWLGVRPPAFRPRGGRAHHDGLTPARTLVQSVAACEAWPVSERGGDLAALDEASVIDAATCALLAHRCLHGAGDRWAMIGTQQAGRIALAACPEMIDRATVNIDRMVQQGMIFIPRGVAGSDVGPPQSW